MQVDENKLITKEYRTLLKNCKHLNLTSKDKKEIRNALDMAMKAHSGIRRKSGELYIFHPLNVAIICASEIGLGRTSIIAALLHDVVEDTDVTLKEIENIFGKKVATIIDGLTKISEFVGKSPSMQAENFKKLLLTMADDIRVILVKLADRLHNMRTLESVGKNTQLKISSETLMLFAPLAHRLGLHTIKTELEDLSLKYMEPEVYKDISVKLQQTKVQRNKYIKKFIEPLEKAISNLNIKFEIKGRPKSIYSIYNKMKKQNIPFEQVFDLFAIRIIIDTTPDLEKTDCFQVLGIVNGLYSPNPDRLRDWLSTPKSNGYESLHSTVMGPYGKWVEVQIRSKRMDEIAEKGYAAHWKYKENSIDSSDHQLEVWIKNIREHLESSNTSALDFFDDFKLNLFSDEVFAFTPKGEMITLPLGATALDFAFEIHSDIGLHCLGVKINHKLVPLSTRLKNGDQVEIITAKKVKPTIQWLNYVVTAKAKSKILENIKEQKRDFILEGRVLISNLFKEYNLVLNQANLIRLTEILNYPSENDLLYNIAEKNVNQVQLKEGISQIHEAIRETETIIPVKNIGKLKLEDEEIRKKVFKDIVVGEPNEIAYGLAKCCNPINGDNIFGFITLNDGIKIHRTNCPNGIRLMSNFGDRIIKATWKKDFLEEIKKFTVGIRLSGIDGLGILSSITDIISKEMQININSILVTSEGGTFTGSIILQISNTKHLNNILNQLKKLEGIDNVSRFEVEDDLNTSLKNFYTKAS
jgi:GTP pyrophosphokinase